MKKMTRTIIAVVTILVFALTSSAAFAADGAGVKSGIDAAKSGSAAVTEKAAQQPVKEVFGQSYTVMKGYTVKSAGQINAKTVNYASTGLDDPVRIETGNNGSYKWYSVGVNTNGKMYVDAAVAYNSDADYVTIAISTTSGTEGIKTTRSIKIGDDVEFGIGGVDVTESKKYWIGIQASSHGAALVRPYVFSYKTRFLKAGKVMLSSGYKGNFKDSAVKYRIRPTKSGYITVALKEYGYDKSAGYVQLLTKGKKTASKKLWYYQGSDTSYVVFGVKKGVTYYLKVTNCSGTYDNYYAYGIRYKITKSPVRKNTKKRKAVKLKRKGAWKKTVLLGNNRSGNQWYKFKVTKKRTTKISVDTIRVKSGTVKMTVYCGKKKIDTVTLSNGVRKPYTITYSTTWGKAKRGTYYVKIHKSRKATGQYRIKYVK